jgi:hypothetical protein
MALLMRLTNGTDTLFDLTGAGCAVRDETGALASTGRPAADTQHTAIDLRLTGGMAAIQGSIQTVERCLDQARRYEAARLGAPVYLEARVRDDDEWKRSRVLDGWFSKLTPHLAALTGVMMATLTLERVNYFEASAETQLPLTNANGTNNTTGLKVYNCNDQSGAAPNKRVNHVDIAAPSGDLPAPLRLEITNNYNDGVGASLIYAGLATYADLTTFDPLLEAEAAAGGSTTANSAASGGNYSTATLATSGDIQLWTWTLTAARMAACAGRTYKLIARFVSGSYTDVWFYPYIFYNSVVPLRQGALVRPSNYYARVLRDLGAVQLPPWLAGVGSPGALSLRLYGRRAVDSSLNVALDFLFLMPTDGFREYQLTGALEYNYTLVDDGVADHLYIQDASAANRMGNVTGIGDPLMVVPGRAARIYFLHHSESGNSAAITRTLSIKAYYRPRRLTL